MNRASFVCKIALGIILSACVADGIKCKSGLSTLGILLKDKDCGGDIKTCGASKVLSTPATYYYTCGQADAFTGCKNKSHVSIPGYDGLNYETCFCNTDLCKAAATELKAAFFLGFATVLALGLTYFN